MKIQNAPGIPSEATYPYQENVQHTDVYKCRFNQSTAAGTTTGYGRIRPGNETLLKDVVSAVGPVSFAMNSDPTSFLFYG